MKKEVINELKRLKKHYENEVEKNKHPFDGGIVEGLSYAISICENEEIS